MTQNRTQIVQSMTTEKIFNDHARQNLSDGGVDRTFNGGLQIAKNMS